MSSNKRQAPGRQSFLNKFFTPKQSSHSDEGSNKKGPENVLIKSDRTDRREMEKKERSQDEDLVPQRMIKKKLERTKERDVSQQDYKASQKEDQQEEEQQFDNDSDQEDLKSNKKKKGTTGKKQKTGRKKNVSKIERADQPEVEKDFTSQGNDNVQFTDKTPQWALSPNCRDKKQRLPTDPMYDPTTLYIPPKQYTNLTHSMKQYWTLKSEHFDKILFFKIGKFYELFYEDAVIGNKHLSLKWMGTKMHTGFPEKSIEFHLASLVQLGFKVVVVDQTETPKQMLHRLKKQKQKGNTKSQKVVKREITAIHTKGTSLIGLSDQNYMPNYLISFIVHDNIHAFSLFDHMTNSIHLGACKSLEQFKSVIYNTRPTELLYDPTNLPFEYKKMMTESFLGMIQSRLENKNNQWHFLNARKQLEELPEGQKHIKLIDNHFEDDQEFIMKTLSGLFAYLKSLFLLDNTLEISKFKVYNSVELECQSLILDSQAVQHLELFQTGYFEKPEQGSLFKTIDRCSTNFGKRMLRQWLLKPSRNEKIINDRLDAVEDLNSRIQERKKISDKLKSFGDLEKLVNRTYHFASKSSQSNKAIFYEDLNVKKLKQIHDLSRKLEQGYHALSDLQRSIPMMKSQRLKRLLTKVSNEKTLDDEQIYFENQEQNQEVDGLLPNVIFHIKQLSCLLKWQNNIPIPQKGLVPQYDQAEAQIEQKKQELERYIQKLRIKYRQPNIKFTHAKQRYQIQVPENLKQAQSMIFSSRRNGYTRYVTPESRNLVSELEEIQQEKKGKLKSFVNFFCQQFSRKKNIWQRFVRVLAELDCLFSISIVSYQWDGVRPTFTNTNGMQIIGAQHPCLSSSQFIANDITLTNKTNIMMLSGPNMGGKSTLLRTSCLLIILAQVGIRIPCLSYNCHVFDRVFTRIGASDKLSQGKSTFFIQMQQALTIIKLATDKSFIIMDQLGRGTSTFDGMSIAYGVIRDLALNIKCLGIVSTHYHMLIQEFHNQPSIVLKTMDYQVDDKSKRIVFLYKIKDGYCKQSFAFNVVRAVGLKEEILTKAEMKANMIYEEIQSKREEQMINRRLQELVRRAKGGK